MKAPLLEQSPDHTSLKQLREQDILSAPAFWEGIRTINEPEAWARWAARLCLMLGTALLLAALVCFLAFNWAELGHWQKFGILQAVTVLAIIGGQIVGFRRLSGQLLLTAAALSVGVGFAVYGQVYQTGADAFGFFGMWAVCILPWVIAGTFAPLWVLWLTLVNLTLWFFWDQVGHYHASLHYTYLCAALGAVNGFGLIAREYLHCRYVWLQGAWLRPLFVFAALTPLLVAGLNLVVGSKSEEIFPLAVGAGFWLLAWLASGVYFTRVRFDVTVLCILLGQLATLVLCAFSRLIDDADLYHGGGGFFLMAIATIGIAVTMVHLIRWLRRCTAQRKGTHNETRQSHS